MGQKNEDRLDKLDYYSLLGLETGASADQVRQAFHLFALKYHPDRHVGKEDHKLVRADHIFKRGAEAYSVLLDPDARRRYDIGLKKGRLRFDPTADDEEPSSLRPHSKKMMVKSAKARPFVKKAEQAMRSEDWQTAKLNLKIAMQHEPGNELLEARLAAVEASMKKK